MAFKDYFKLTCCLLAFGCNNEDSEERGRNSNSLINKSLIVREAVIKDSINKFPNDFYVDSNYHFYIKIRDNNGEIRDFRSELRNLEKYLNHIEKNNSTDKYKKEEILRVKTIMVHGYYLLGRFGREERQEREKNISCAKILAKEVFSSVSIKARNDFYMCMLSDNPSDFEDTSNEKINNKIEKSLDNHHSNHTIPEISGFYWINSQPLRLENFRDKTILLYFWADWCGPCLSKLPSLERIWKNYNKDFVIIGIHNSSKDTFHLEQLVQEYNLTFPIMIDNGETFYRYSVNSIPRQILIDKDSKEDISLDSLEALLGEQKLH